MSLKRTFTLIDWLEKYQPGRRYSLDDVKELFSIAMKELAEQNNKTFESLPQGSIDAIIESMKANGEYYQLQKMIDNFKLRYRSNQ